MFRLVLALMVTLSHFSRFDVGKCAVMLFFMLSGYWVGLLYQQQFSRTLPDVARFYLSRYLRIWPIYAVAVLVCFTVYRLMGINFIGQLPPAMLLVGIANHRQHDFLRTSWSLDIELQFYLILPALFWIMNRYAPSRSALSVVGVLTLLCTVLGWWLTLRQSTLTVLAFLPLFLIGLSWVVRPVYPSRTLIMLSCVFFILVPVLCQFHPQLHNELIRGKPHIINRDLFGMFWALSLAPFVAHNVRQKSSAFDRQLGNLSYPIYLVHVPTLLLCTSAWQHWPMWVVKPAALLSVFIIAATFYFLVDAPLERWRHSFIRGLGSKRTPSAP